MHPSWRDLVIERLSADGPARRSFLAACGIEGAMLALSTAGGNAGEVSLPLLHEDADWDALSDRLGSLVLEVEERELARLLYTFTVAERADLGARRVAELDAVAKRVLEGCGRRLCRCEVGIALLVYEPWLELAAQLAEPPTPPGLGLTWIDLVPPERSTDPSRADLQRSLDWLRLVEMLARHAPAQLDLLGFPDSYEARIDSLLEAAGWQAARQLEPERRVVLADILDSVDRLIPGLHGRVGWLLGNLPLDDRTPASAAPRSFEATHAEPATEIDVLRVLRDL